MTEFLFLGTRSTCEIFDCGRTFLKTLRLGTPTTPPALREGIHWIYVGRDVRFNVALLHDFFVNRANPDAHQRAIDAYLASLPSSQAAA